MSFKFSLAVLVFSSFVVASLASENLVWEGNCTECVGVSETEWSVTCQGGLRGVASTYKTRSFTTVFTGATRNVCKRPLYQLRKLLGTEVVLENTPRVLRLEVKDTHCQCERPKPSQVSCIPSLTLNLLGEEGKVEGQNELEGFSLSRYCMSGGKPSPCKEEVEKELYELCMDTSFRLFDAFSKESLVLKE